MYIFIPKAVTVVTEVVQAVSILALLTAAVLVVSTPALPIVVAPEAQVDLVVNTQAKTTNPVELPGEYETYKEPIKKYYLREA